MLRRVLDGLYLSGGYLAALFLVGIAASIIAQVVGRYFGYVIDSTEIAGFCLAASTFLGLAYTLRCGSHIRVTLLIRNATGSAKRWVELWCIGFTALAMLYFTYWTIDFVYFSWSINEKSPGLMAVPFWIPRLGMALGLLLLSIALVDELVAVLSGHEPSYEANAEPIFPADEAAATESARERPD